MPKTICQCGIQLTTVINTYIFTMLCISSSGIQSGIIELEEISLKKGVGVMPVQDSTVCFLHPILCRDFSVLLNSLGLI